MKSDASHPSWVCGLKLRGSRIICTPYCVTPFVGVWIETFCCLHKWRLLWVTPFVGVWIETMVLPKTRSDLSVTPFVGVWIETPLVHFIKWEKMSHPSWVCGLKLTYDFQIRCCIGHTLRGCVD